MNLFDKIMDVIYVHCNEENLDVNNASFNSMRNGLLTKFEGNSWYVIF